MADRATESLAFGEERLLELARALAAAPTVLLLDEPLSGLNPDEVEAVLASIRAARAGRGRGAAGRARRRRAARASPTASWCSITAARSPKATPQAVAADPLVIDAYIGDELE